MQLGFYDGAGKTSANLYSNAFVLQEVKLSYDQPLNMYTQLWSAPQTGVCETKAKAP